MRGDLDETLARLARREEALRRRGADPGDEPGREPAAPTVPAQAAGHPVGWGEPAARAEARQDPTPAVRVDAGAGPDAGTGDAAAPATRPRLVGDVGQDPADALPRRTGGVPALPAAPALTHPALAQPALAQPALAQPAGVAGRDPVDEVAEAVARVVAAHPGMTVALRVEHDGQAYPLRVGWSNGRVTVGAEAATVPPPVWPLTVKAVPAWPSDADRLKVDPAARLAELIRRDPSLLDSTDPTR
ncbi:hypothetical protein GA0070558_10842 [Micromonospora haikouensis]|uniref:Uncharacterized protein n=1 Tax=Micromonospora haikouensis TaxID=686309 RepID=A0A1C4VC65_9ACTN|nr:hypothetical protein [Micromonospora haikouensis]SCE81486.1 hypothetical protein GA0070558_10842 [Micromonospora haikouensis]